MTGHFSSLLANDQPGQARVPVTVLTGFLGSGKTTLLNRLLREPDLQGTAVIVNEFGEVGIDHDLIAHTTEDTILLANGCMCCAVRGDLVGALLRLGQDEGRTAQPLRQVLIETSGLADPGPILRTLMGEPGVRERFVLAGVCCTVDAALGLGTLERHPESLRQVAVADALFLTKTDLVPGPMPDDLLTRLYELNPGATVHSERECQPAVLRELMELRRPPQWAATAAADALHYRPVGGAAVADGAAPTHGEGISSFVIVRDEPLPRDGFAAWLDMVIAMRGEDLLRVKGIVHLAEQPEQPMVIHGVQHLFHPPEFLPAWPGTDRRTRIVFITRGVDVQALDESLSVIARRRRPRPTASPLPNTSKTSETP